MNEVVIAALSASSSNNRIALVLVPQLEHGQKWKARQQTGCYADREYFSKSRVPSHTTKRKSNSEWKKHVEMKANKYNQRSMNYF